MSAKRGKMWRMQAAMICSAQKMSEYYHQSAKMRNVKILILLIKHDKLNIIGGGLDTQGSIYCRLVLCTAIYISKMLHFYLTNVLKFWENIYLAQYVLSYCWQYLVQLYITLQEYLQSLSPILVQISEGKVKMSLFQPRGQN